MIDRRRVIADWWRARIGARDSSQARALAARLARGDGVEVLVERAVFDLAHTLDLERQPERMVSLVRVLACVRENGGGSLPRRLGQDEAMSQLRFQRLIRSEGAELETQLRRALPMVDRRCDVGALGADLLSWDDKTRARWAFAYFGAAAPESLSPAPTGDQSNTSEETPS